MKKIASFEIDHNKLPCGIYISRTDGDIITYDVRLKLPNAGDYLDYAAIHSIEHLFATFVRNSKNADGILYFGPMGCRTGFYFITRGISHAEVIKLIKESFAFIASFEGDIPGVSKIECGNYLEHSLKDAKTEAEKFLPFIENWTQELLVYPK